MQRWRRTSPPPKKPAAEDAFGPEAKGPHFWSEICQWHKPWSGTGTILTSFYCLIHRYFICLWGLQPLLAHLSLQQQGPVSEVWGTGRGWDKTSAGQNIAEGFRTIHGRGKGEAKCHWKKRRGREGIKKKVFFAPPRLINTTCSHLPNSNQDREWQRYLRLWTGTWKQSGEQEKQQGGRGRCCSAEPNCRARESETPLVPLCTKNTRCSSSHRSSASSEGWQPHKTLESLFPHRQGGRKAKGTFLGPLLLAWAQNMWRESWFFSSTALQLSVSYHVLCIKTVLLCTTHCFCLKSELRSLVAAGGCYTETASPFDHIFSLENSREEIYIQGSFSQRQWIPLFSLRITVIKSRNQKLFLRLFTPNYHLLWCIPIL